MARVTLFSFSATPLTALEAAKQEKKQLAMR
jgi:hypothetical protein